MLEIIEYRSFGLQVGPVGKGWRASIYSAGSASALPDSPTNLEKSRKDEIVADEEDCRYALKVAVIATSDELNPISSDFNPTSVCDGAVDSRPCRTGAGCHDR
jgi:hypothetical protein